MTANHYLIIICFEESVGEEKEWNKREKEGGSSDFKNSKANVCLRKEGKAIAICKFQWLDLQIKHSGFNITFKSQNSIFFVIAIIQGNKRIRKITSKF